MHKKTATSPEKKMAFEAIKMEFRGNDCGTQRTRVLEALRRIGAASTYELRQYLDIYFPPARIKELRDLGHKIETHWTYITTEVGDLHHVGLYGLQSEATYAAS